MIIIGLTGNIGSGKSTVARRLLELGAQVLDSDIVTRELVAPGSPALAQIARAFGEAVLTPQGQLDRDQMGAIIFKDPSARARLEAILHPLVEGVFKERIRQYRQSPHPAPALVLEVPLLIEANMHGMVDVVWLVAADQETQIRRVMARNGLTREQTLQRVAAQMPQEKKAAYAQEIIDNSGTPEDTLRQVDKLWQELLPLSSKGSN